MRKSNLLLPLAFALSLACSAQTIYAQGRSVIPSMDKKQKVVQRDGENLNPVQNLTYKVSGQTVTLNWEAPAGGSSEESVLSENFDSGSLPLGWTTIDADGDGHNWIATFLFNQGAGHKGSTGMISSSSYYGDPLKPNNYLVTPTLNLVNGGTLTFWVCAQDVTAAAEHYAVYASTTGNIAADFTTPLIEETIATKSKTASNMPRGSRDQTEWKKKTVTLPAGTQYVAFRHFDCTDMYWLNIDDVEITANTKRTEILNEGFETAALPEGWTLIDADGDGFNWESTINLYNTKTHTGVGALYSSSYRGDAMRSLDPDNYLVTPHVTIPQNGKLTYWISSQDIWPEEHYGVFLSTTGNKASDFTVELFSETLRSKNANPEIQKNETSQRPTAEYRERTIDLSAYAGQRVYLAFRHYESPGVFHLYIDDVVISGENTISSNYTYTVYRDGTLIAKDLTAKTYKQEGVAEGTYNYCVEVKYAAGVSPKECVSVKVSNSSPELAPITDLKANKDNDDVVLTWNAPAPKVAERTEMGNRQVVLLSVTDSPELLRSGEAEIVLEAHDVWKDGSGYQILLDADHNEIGKTIFDILYENCDIPADYYDPFEYSVPENADPSCTPKNMVVDDIVSVKIPAGTYDYVIAAPQAGKTIWIAGGQNSKGDDYVFEAGKKYHFLMHIDVYIDDKYDISELTITNSTPDYTYTVYRDGTQVAAGLAETTYKDLGMAANNHEYCVQVKYTAGESAKVCVNYVASSIEDVTAAKPYSIAVTGKTITVTSNGRAMIYDMNGRRVAAGSQVVSYTAQSGFYAVRISVDGKTYVERLVVK